MHSAIGAQSESQIAADAAVFWRASDQHEIIRDLSHWLGEGRWADASLWRAIGRKHVALFGQLCGLAELARPPRRMLEWGPGGGANAVCFSPLVDSFVAVDISAANLEECGRQLAATMMGAHFTAVEIDADAPEQALNRIREPVDFFLCTAVYQHFPSKDYGARVTRIARQLLTAGGVALIQIRYDDGSATFRPKDRDYFDNAVTFTSYDPEEFAAVVSDAGFESLRVDLEPASRYAYYLLQAR